MADLTVWLPQEFWQGPPLPEWMGVYWPWYSQPGIELRDLMIEPVQVEVGQTVNITVKAVNRSETVQTKDISCIVT